MSENFSSGTENSKHALAYSNVKNFAAVAQLNESSPRMRKIGSIPGRDNYT